MLYIAIGFFALTVGIFGFKFYSGFKDSCYGGNGDDCYAKSIRYAKLHLPDDSAKFAQMACKNGVYEGCLDFGEHKKNLVFFLKLETTMIRHATFTIISAIRKPH